MAGAKNHDYHILPPSITPILGSFSALTMCFGLVMWMHPEQFSDERFGPDTRHVVLVQQMIGKHRLPGSILTAIRLD